MFWVGYLSCWFFLRYYFCECQPINIQLFNWSSDNDDAGHFQHLFHVCGALPYSKRLWLSFFSLMVPLLCSDIFLIRLLWVRLVLFSVVFIYTVTLYNSILFVYSFCGEPSSILTFLSFSALFGLYQHHKIVYACTLFLIFLSVSFSIYFKDGFQLFSTTCLVLLDSNGTT